MNSVLRRRVFKSLTPCFSSPFSSSVRSLLNARLNESSMKDAIRFENQNKTWTYKEIETHSDAFAYGLLELGYKKGDRVLLWVDRAFTSEITIAQLGMAKVGVAFVPLVSSTAGDFEKALKDSDCKGVVFSPNTKHDGKKRIETINQIFPQLETAYSGQQNAFSNYPNLKHLIHVGFNTIPGTIKYRQLLVYANPNFNTNKLPTELDGSVPLIYGQHQGSYKEYTVRDINDFAENFRSQNNVERGDFIGVAGCPYCPGTFAAGAYQSLAFGNYTILYGNENFKNLVQKVQIQHPSHLIIHEKFNSADLSTTVDHESLNRLKKVFVSSKDEGSYSNLFGGKVSGFNAYW